MRRVVRGVHRDSREYGPCPSRTAAADTYTADPKFWHLFPLEKMMVKQNSAHTLHPAVKIARVSPREFHVSMPNTQGLPQRNELRVQPDRRRQAVWVVPRAGSAVRQSGV